jgi:hypothetical protein
MPAGHECRQSLVRDLDKVHFVARPIEGAEDAIDAVTGVAVDAGDSPIAKPFQ